MTSLKYDFILKAPTRFSIWYFNGFFFSLLVLRVISVAVVVKRLVTWVGVLVMCCVTVTIMKYFHTPRGKVREQEKALITDSEHPTQLRQCKQSWHGSSFCIHTCMESCLCPPIPFLSTPCRRWLPFSSHSKCFTGPAWLIMKATVYNWW